METDVVSNQPFEDILTYLRTKRRELNKTMEPMTARFLNYVRHGFECKLLAEEIAELTRECDEITRLINTLVSDKEPT